MASSQQKTVNKPFNDALQQYISKLDPLDMERFKQSITTADDVIQEAKSLNTEHKNKSWARKIVSRFSHSVRTLEVFFGAIDVAVGASPQVAGIVWGSLKIVFELTHRFSDFFEAVVDVLESLSVDLPFYQDYATTLYSQSESMQKALAAVYDDVFAVFTAVRKVFKNKQGTDRKTLSVMFRAFSSDLDGITSKLTSRQEVVEREARHAERLSSNEERDLAAAERSKQELERTMQELERQEAKQERESNKQREEQSLFYTRLEAFYKLLDPTDCTEKHKISLNVHTQPKCWLLETKEYKEWYARSSGMLWVNAKAGAGKTVLMSVVIDSILKEKQPDTQLAFFYCQYDDLKRRDPTSILATLLSQLLSDPENMGAHQASLITQHGSTKSVYTLDLVDLILKAAKDFQKVYLAIDALDECTGQRELLSALNMLATQCCLIVSSRRDEEEIIGSLHDAPQIAIQTENIKDDISHFVKTEIEAHRRLSCRPAQLKDEIIESLTKGADGMFLWVSLQLKQISDQRTDHDIRTVLQQLPKGLPSTYIRALERIESGPSSKWAKRVLRWVLCAGRPLSLAELGMAVSCEEMDTEDWDSSREFNNEEALIYDCGNLLVCVPELWRKSTVHFIHTSVKDFLLTDPGVLGVSLPQYHIYPVEKGHQIIAVQCMKYITTQRKSSAASGEALFPVNYQWSSPQIFDYYAKNYWTYHLQLSNSADSHTVELFKILLSYPEVLKHYGGGSEVHVAVKRDMPALIACLLKDFEVDVHALDDEKNTLLHMIHDPSQLKLLLKRNSEVSNPNLEGDCPLHETARSGIAESLKLLLDHGATVNVKNMAGCTPLHEAARSGIAESLKLLLDHGATANVKNMAGCTPLHEAANHEAADCVALLLRHGADASIADLKGSTALHEASKSFKMSQSVVWLIQNGANANSKDTNHTTPLHEAVRNRVHESAESLIFNGANVNAKDLHGMTPLHQAIIFQAFETAQFLLKSGADVNSVDNSSRSLLHYATARDGRAQFLQLLLDHRAFINSRDINGMTPLHYASQKYGFCISEGFASQYLNEHKHKKFSWNIRTSDYTFTMHNAQIEGGQGYEAWELAKILIKHGADINAVDSLNKTPLQYAAEKEGPLAFLIQHGANVNKPDIEGKTLLHSAIDSEKSLNWIEFLLQHGADPNGADKLKLTPLHYACQQYAAEEKVKLLIKYGGRLDIKSSAGCTALHYAAMTFGASGSVKAISKLGASIHAKDNEGKSPIHYTIDNNESLRLLVAYGANINALDHKQRTLLHHAIAACKPLSSVMFLVQQGADIHARDRKEMTPLHYAAREFGGLKIVEFLLQNGAYINVVDEDNMTALHYAAHQSTGTETVMYLLNLGANVNVFNSHQMTPLHYAVKVFGNLEAVKLLVKHGAGINAKDVEQQTPLGIAEKEKNYEVVKFLKDMGARK